MADEPSTYMDRLQQLKRRHDEIQVKHPSRRQVNQWREARHAAAIDVLQDALGTPIDDLAGEERRHLEHHATSLDVWGVASLAALLDRARVNGEAAR